ncbi:MAG: 16S rRNA (guanine527-N7)-methyltransferase [Cellvibrionaceae bacterium]|jgi:16S rRNA (guanine527-N7)-methyltransferase
MSNWSDYSKHFNIVLTAEQLEQFAIYERLLLEWNSRMNLTAVRDSAGIQLRHFLDSLSGGLIPAIDQNSLSLIDVGTGAGLPGLPLKIVYPQIQLTLTDSVARKTRFLEAVVAELGLQHVSVLAERAETLGQLAEHREQYDIALARSVAFMPVLLEYLLPLTKIGGRAICFKGDNAKTEYGDGEFARGILGGGEPDFIEVDLPEHERLHYLVIYHKLAPTPTDYPRRPGRPLKKPLIKNR